MKTLLDRSDRGPGEACRRGVQASEWAASSASVPYYRHRANEGIAVKWNERSQIGGGLPDDTMDGVKVDLTGRLPVRISSAIEDRGDSP